MKKTGLLIFILIFALSLSLFAFIHNAGADAGDFSGDSDYGGSDYSYDYNDDYDYSYYDDDDGYSGGGSGGISDRTIIFIIVAGFILYTVVSSKKKNKDGSPTAPGARPETGLLSVSALKEKDPAFSEAEVSEMISNLYVRLQNAWTAKDLSPVRPYLTDALYAQLDRQLDTYRQSGQTNIVERIAVLGVEIRGYKENSETQAIYATVSTRITDYVVRDSDGEITRGSRTAEKFMTYEWELIRSQGSLTRKPEDRVVHNCPNCGAPLDINRTAKCEYCGSIVTVKDFDWALTSIKGLSQRTVGK